MQVRAPFEKDASGLQVPYLTLQPFVAQAELMKVLTYPSSTVPRTCGLSFARNCNFDLGCRCVGLMLPCQLSIVMKPSQADQTSDIIGTPRVQVLPSLL